MLVCTSCTDCKNDGFWFASDLYFLEFSSTIVPGPLLLYLKSESDLVIFLLYSPDQHKAGLSSGRFNSLNLTD